VTNTDVRPDGDRATSRAEFYHPMLTTRRDESRGILFVGGEYHDRLVRTPARWRITEALEQSV